MRQHLTHGQSSGVICFDCFLSGTLLLCPLSGSAHPQKLLPCQLLQTRGEAAAPEDALYHLAMALVAGLAS